MPKPRSNLLDDESVPDAVVFEATMRLNHRLVVAMKNRAEPYCIIRATELVHDDDYGWGVEFYSSLHKSPFVITSHEQCFDFHLSGEWVRLWVVSENVKTRRDCRVRVVSKSSKIEVRSLNAKPTMAR
jgi:hypothetical protein